MHVSFVHCVVMLQHYSHFPRSTLCKIFFEKDNYFLHSLTYWLKMTCCKSGAKTTLYNVVMKGFPLPLHIFICTWPFCFAVTWCLSATSMYLSVSSNDPRMKSESYGVMWHVAPKSKIKLVNCELSPYFSLEHSSLLDIRAIYAYIFWSLLFYTSSYEDIIFLILGMYTRYPFWCSGIPTKILQNPFCAWWRIFNVFVKTCAVAFCTTYRQN